MITAAAPFWSLAALRTQYAVRIDQSFREIGHDRPSENLRSNEAVLASASRPVKSAEGASCLTPCSKDGAGSINVSALGLAALLRCQKSANCTNAKCRKVAEPLGDRGTFRIFASQIEPAGSTTAASVDKPTHERRRDSRPRADLATNSGT